MENCLKRLRCPPFFAAAAILITLSSSPSMAASAGKILSEDQVTKSLLSQGYAEVIRMEMEDGQYEVVVKTKDGKRKNLNVNPRTGQIVGVHKDSLFSK